MRRKSCGREEQHPSEETRVCRQGKASFAVRKGRGPGEMINGSSLHKNGDGAVFYDSGSAVCVKIRTKESISSHTAVMDTIGVFAAGASRPVYMTSCGKDGFISGNLLDQDVWYFRLKRVIMIR